MNVWQKPRSMRIKSSREQRLYFFAESALMFHGDGLSTNNNMERMPMTFDAWEAQVRPSNGLMHSGIRGMKHGLRRYQNPDGTWTDAGLEARRQREGWGNGRKARKAARAERRKARRAAYLENRRKNDVRKMSDEELQKRIDRLKKEQEYKELKKSPLLKTGENLIAKYLDYRTKKDEREERRYNMETNRINAKANLRRAKSEKKRAAADREQAIAAQKQAKSDMIDNLTFGKGRKEAKSRLIDAKEKAKSNTMFGIVKGHLKKAWDAKTEADLYKNNEFYRRGVDDRREAERQKRANVENGSKAQVEIAQANARKAEAELEKARLEKNKKKKKG